MPRKARLIVPGAIYHVMARCLDQYQLFGDDADREHFLMLLDTCITRTQTRCYAWVLMDTHYHLVVRIADIELWELLKPLNMRYAYYHKEKTGRRGPLLMDRYKSIATQDQCYAEELVRYVHLNPVRAGICKNLKQLEKHHWCGHAALMGKMERRFQDTRTVLRRFGRNDTDARAGYCRFLEEGMRCNSENDRLLELMRKSNRGTESGRTSGCWVIGDPQFVSQALSSSEARRLRISRFEQEGGDFSPVVHSISTKIAIDEKQLRTRHRGGIHSEARKIFAYVATREFGAPVSKVASYLRVGDSAVSALSRSGRELSRRRGITN